MIELLVHTNNSNNLGENAITQDYGWGMMGGSGMMGWWPGMGGGWLGGLFALVVWVFLILVLIALFRWLWLKGNIKEKRKNETSQSSE